MAKSFLDMVTEHAKAIGDRVRDIKAGAAQALAELQPTLQAAMSAWDSLTDAQKRADLKQVIEQYRTKFLTDGNSIFGSLSQQFNQILEAAGGAPVDVAKTLTMYVGVQAQATEKQGTGLAEVIAADEKVALIRKMMADKAPEDDIIAEGKALDELLSAATAVLDTFDATPEVVARKAKNTGITLADIATAETARAEAETKYLETIKGATPFPATDGLVSVDSLTTSANDANADVAAGNHPAAAVKLHNWDADANAVLEDKRAQKTKLERATRVPVQKKNLLETLVSSYEASQGPLKNNAELSKLYLAANAAIKARPFDATEANEKFDLFESAIRPFTTGESKTHE